MNDTIVDSNSGQKILLDITGFQDEKVFYKQDLTVSDHSKSSLNEESNGVVTLNTQTIETGLSEKTLDPDRS